MSKTLVTGQSRVFSLIGVNPDKSEPGQYGRTEVTVAINTAQRFIVKSAIPASLGALARRTVHVVAGSTPTNFTKHENGNGRTLLLAIGTAMTDEIPILAPERWLAKSKVEQYSSSNLQSYYAMEMGAAIYIRPHFAAQTAVTEFYVDDPTDMEDSTDVYSLPDDWFEWVNMNAAAILLMAGDRPEKLASLTNLMTGWSAAFRAQWGINPPNVMAPAAAGKVT